MSNDYRDGLRALDESQTRPCGLCLKEPRAHGDHLCKRCRKRLNDARDAYDKAKEQTR